MCPGAESNPRPSNEDLAVDRVSPTQSHLSLSQHLRLGSPRIQMAPLMFVAQSTSEHGGVLLERSAALPCFGENAS